MKKLLVFLLLTCLLLGSFPGCKAAGPVSPASDPAANEPAPSAVPATEEPAADAAQTLQFTTTDLDGATVSMDDFRDAKLILVNYWEPWCGPCVGELPELARLYDDYAEQGLVILGVFSSLEDDAKRLAEENGVHYPLLHANEELAQFMTSYVPTTILVSPDGTVLLEEPLIGANDYAGWEAVIRPYLAP